MGFRAAFTSFIRAVSRPHLVLPAAFVAVIALLSPPAIEDASAQGFRMQGSRGSVSSMGPGRFQSSDRSGDDLEGGNPPERQIRHAVRAATTSVTGIGKGGMGWHGRWHGRPSPGQHRRHASAEGRRSPSAAPAAFPDSADPAAGWRHRRHAAGRSRVGAAVERAVAVAVVASRRRPRNRTSRPPTGAAMCRTRWWSKSHPTSRRRP